MRGALGYVVSQGASAGFAYVATRIRAQMTIHTNQGDHGIAYGSAA